MRNTLLRDEYYTLETGGRVFMRRGGVPGRPLFVLVHGVGMSGAYFGPLAEVLAQDFSVAVLDMPGFGKSRAAGLRDLAGQADVLTSFLLHEKARDVVLLGHSMGTQIISELVKSASRPVRLKAVLIAPTVNPAERTPGWQMLRLFQDIRFERLGLVVTLLRDYFRCGPRIYAQALGHMLTQDVAGTLPACRVRTLVIAGSKDPIVPLAWAGKAAALIPKSRFAQVPAGHAAHYYRCREVARLCKEFALDT